MHTSEIKALIDILRIDPKEALFCNPFQSGYLKLRNKCPNIGKCYIDKLIWGGPDGNMATGDDIRCMFENFLAIYSSKNPRVNS